MKKFIDNVLPVIAGVVLVVIMIAMANMHSIVPQDKKVQKVQTDTVKTDTLSIHQQQMIYKKQMSKQENRLDSLIKAKKKKK